MLARRVLPATIVFGVLLAPAGAGGSQDGGCRAPATT